MKLITPGQDRWHRLSGENGPQPHLNPHSAALLGLEQWHAVRGHWPHGLSVGIELPNSAEIEPLAEDLPRIGLIVLEFPKWTDGRAYSQARLLRARLRYAGELRASGDVVADMLPLLRRTGFDAAVLRADQKPETVQRALGFFDGHYQGDTLQPQPWFRRAAA